MRNSIGEAAKGKVVEAKAVEKEAALKVDAGADNGLTEEERNDRLTQAMERWWQYEAGA